MFDLENLRWMIKNSGMSFNELSKRTGINNMTLRRIVNDENYNPTYSTMQSLLKYFRG